MRQRFHYIKLKSGPKTLTTDIPQSPLGHPYSGLKNPPKHFFRPAKSISQIREGGIQIKTTGPAILRGGGQNPGFLPFFPIVRLTT